MIVLLSIATPLSDSLDSDVFIPRCHVLVGSRELPMDLVFLDVIEFDVILGMDWLSQHYTVVDYQSKEVIFRILDEEEFKFVSDKSSVLQNLISTITARKMLRKGYQGYIYEEYFCFKCSDSL